MVIVLGLSLRKVTNFISACCDQSASLSPGASLSGPRQGPAERCHVKKRQKMSNIFFCVAFRRFSRRAKKLQKMSKLFFDTFRYFSRGTTLLAPFWEPLILLEHEAFPGKNASLIRELRSPEMPH